VCTVPPRKSPSRHMRSVGTKAGLPPSIWFDADVIVHGNPKLLFAVEVPLGRLNAYVSEQSCCGGSCGREVYGYRPAKEHAYYATGLDFNARGHVGNIREVTRENVRDLFLPACASFASSRRNAFSIVSGVAAGTEIGLFVPRHLAS
jgi:hypothetical protein